MTMKKFFFFLIAGILFGACKENKKLPEQSASPYRELADQYAEFTLTTDLSQLSENEKK